MKKWLILLVAALLIPSQALAQTLVAGEHEFSVTLSIFLSPLVHSPYGGNPKYNQTLLSKDHPLGLGGDQDYLNIRWKAYFSDGVVRNINVSCYLNEKTQNCTRPNYNSGSEDGCTINNPIYNYKDFNTVFCNFTSTDYPAISGVVNRSFQPAALIISAKTAGMSVGKEFQLRVNIINIGLLPTSFSVNITHDEYYLGKLSIRPQSGTTNMVSYGGTAVFDTYVTFFAADQYVLQIRSRPMADISTCLVNTDCSNTVYGDDTRICVNGRCWMVQTLDIKVGFANLPEFDILGILQIIFLSAVVFSIILMKKANKIYK